MSAEVQSFEGTEHIELDLEDLFVDDVPVTTAERERATQRRTAAGADLTTWAIVGLLVGLGSLGVAALLLRPPRWRLQLR